MTELSFVWWQSVFLSSSHQVTGFCYQVFDLWSWKTHFLYLSKEVFSSWNRCLIFVGWWPWTICPLSWWRILSRSQTLSLSLFRFNQVLFLNILNSTFDRLYLLQLKLHLIIFSLQTLDILHKIFIKLLLNFNCLIFLCLELEVFV